MKGLGIFFLVCGGLDIIVGIIALVGGENEAAGTKLVEGLMVGVLGAFLVHRANQKNEKTEKKQHWENENK